MRCPKWIFLRNRNWRKGHLRNRHGNINHRQMSEIIAISTQFLPPLSSPVRLMGERIQRPIKISKEFSTIVNQIKLMDHVMWFCSRRVRRRMERRDFEKQTDCTKSGTWLIIANNSESFHNFLKKGFRTTDGRVGDVLPTHLVCRLIYNHSSSSSNA